MSAGGAPGRGPEAARWVTEELASPFEDELAALALTADPGEPPSEAAPLPLYLDEQQSQLPGWYMPAAVTRGGGRWRTVVLLLLVAAFIAVEAAGLCSTYGPVVVH